MNRLFLPFIIFFIFCVKSFGQDKPNILFVLVDDLGYHDLSCHGSSIYQTPHIDQLASESVTFTNAYSNYPRCVPSRYALLTATYPLIGQEVPDDGEAIKKASTAGTIIDRFNQAGFKTAYFGKWHLGDGDSSPQAIGFDTSVAAGKAGSPISFFYPFNTPKKTNRKVKKAPIKDFGATCSPGDYLTDVLTDHVIDFIDQSKAAPFMAVVAYYAVHQPLEAKEQDVERNRKEISQHDYGDLPAYISEGTGRTKMRQDHPVYAAMVENLDKNIGRILITLKEKGIADNTLIVFSSDHGGLSNDGYNKRNLATANYPLRAGKGWMYEGGIRVPLFIKNTNRFAAVKDTQSIVMLMDVFPTLLDIVGQEKAAEVDGSSFLPVLNRTTDWSDRTVFWHAANARPKNTGESKSSAIRSGDWKLVYFYELDQVALYHLKQDPYESKDLSNLYPERTKKMLLILNKWKENQ